MTDEPGSQREGIPHAWRMVGAVGLSSMMAATGIFLLGGTDSSASAPTNASSTTPTLKLAPVATTRTTARSTTSTTTKRSTTTAATTTVKAAACTKHYRVRANDSWSLIATEANMTLDALLSLNHATTATMLQPGESICIPADVSVVVATTAPTTAAPTTAKATPITRYVPPATAAPAPVYTPVVHSGGS